MTSISSARPFRRCLRASTVLATGLLVLAQAAHAQDVPPPPPAITLPQVSAGTTPVGAAVNPVADGLKVDVSARRAVIEWANFSIPAGTTVTFTNANPGGATAAVLNRVTGTAGVTTRSEIRGTLDASSSLAVFLVNPSGILFGKGSAVSAGSFFASTQGITNDAFTTGMANIAGGGVATSALAFAGDATGTGAITTEGGAALTATGTNRLGLGNLVLIGTSVSVAASDPGATREMLLTRLASGATDLADQPGDVALVAARDVSVATTAGGPLAITLTRGTPVTGAIEVSGTIKGRNVTLALATQGAVTDALLSVAGVVTATGAAQTDTGVVLAAGAGVPGVVALTGAAATDARGRIALTAPLDSAGGTTLAAGGAVTTAALLNAAAGTSAANRNVSISAGGLATIGGGVKTAGDYLVRGGGITIGTAGAAVAQQAAGRIDLTAATGDIGAAGTPALTANSGDAAYDAAVRRGIVLDATGGAIALSAASLAASNYAVQVRNDAGAPDRPADSARAVALGNVEAFALNLAGAAHDDNRSTAITFKGATTLGALTLSAADISADGKLDVASLATTGAARLSAGAGLNVGAVTTSTGNATLSGAGPVLVTGDVAAGGALSVGSTRGTITAQALSGSSVTLAAPGLLKTGAVTATRFGVAVTGAGEARLGAVTAAASSPGTITLDRGDAITAASLTGGGDIIVGAETRPTTVTVTGAISGRNISVVSSAAQRVDGPVTATIDATFTSSGGDVTLDTVVATRDALVSGAGVRASGITGRQVTITAETGNATLGTLTSTGGDAFVSAVRGAATVSGAVKSAGAFGVTANGVRLGTAGTVVRQQAAGAVTIIATGGAADGLTGRSGLTLLANDGGGSGAAPLTLAAKGPIAFGGTTLLGGPDRQSPVQIRAGTADDAVTLGAIRAQALLGAVGTDPFRPGLVQRRAALTFGDVTLAGPLTLDTSGAIGGGALTATAITLNAGGTLTTAGIAATDGAAMLTGGDGLTAGDISARGTAGSVTIDRGGVLTIGSLAAATDILVGQGRTVTGLTVTGASAAGRDLKLRSGGKISLGGAASGGRDVAVQGSELMLAAVSATGGTLTLTATATDLAVADVLALGDATVTAAGVARVAGAADVGGAYAVSGTSVTLGKVDTRPVQSAGGAVTITATGGMLTGVAGLTLQADRAGTTGGALTLATRGGTGGDIAFAGTRLIGGSVDRPTAVRIATRLPTNVVTLGDVRGASLEGADATGRFVNGLNREAALTVGDVDLTRDLTLATTGTLDGGTLVARSVTLSSDGATTLRAVAARAGPVTISGTGALTVAGDVIARDAVTGQILIDRTGAVALRGADAARDLIVGGGLPAASVTFTGAARAGRDIAVTSRGGQTFTTLDAGREVTLDSGGTLTLATLSAGGRASLASDGLVQADAISAAGGAVSITGTGGLRIAGAGIAATSDAGGDVLIDRTGMIELTATRAARDLRIGGTRAPAALTAGGATSAGRDVFVTTSGAQTYAGAVNGGRDVTLSAAAIRSGAVSAGAGAILTATGGDAIVGALTSGGDAGVTAANGVAMLASLQAGGNATVRAGAVTLGAARVGGLARLTGDAASVVATDLAAGAVAIDARGQATLGRIESVTGDLHAAAGGALTATTLIARGSGDVTGGTLDVGTATARGGTLALTATAGGLRAGEASAAGDLTLAATGDAAVDTAIAGERGTLRVTAASVRGRAEGARARLAAGGDVLVETAGAAFVGPVTAGGGATLTAGRIDVDVLTAGAATLTATAGDLVADTLATTGALGLTARDAVRAGTIGAGGDLAVDAGTFTATDVQIRGASAQLRTRTGDLRVATFRAAGDAGLTSAGGVRIDTAASERGGIAIDAAGAVTLPQVAVATALGVAGASVDVGTATGGTIALASRNGALTIGTAAAVDALRLDAAGGPIVASGALTSGGDTRASGSGDVTFVSLQAGRDIAVAARGSAAAASLTAGRGLAVRAGGDARLTALGAGGDIGIVAGGDARVGGAVRGASYAVEGATVTLGSAGTPVTQAASGAVSIRSTRGAISGLAGLTLQADGDGDAAGDLVLRGAGGIGFAPGSQLLAGVDGSSALRLEAGAGTGIAFDRVVARTIASYTPTLDATEFAGAGPLAITRLTLRDATVLRLSGDLADARFGMVTTGGALTVRTPGQLRADSIAAQGDLVLGGGSIGLGTVTAGSASIAAAAGALDLARLEARGAATLSAATDARIGAVTAVGALAVDAGGDIGGPDGQGRAVLASSGDAVRVTTHETGSTGGTVRLASVNAGDGIAVAGRTVDILSADAGAGTATIAARRDAGATGSAGALTIGDVAAGAGIALSGAGDGDGAIRLGTATARGGALTIAAPNGTLTALDGTSGTALDARGPRGTIAVATGGAAIVASARASGAIAIAAGDAANGRAGRVALASAVTDGAVTVTASDAGIVLGDVAAGSVAARATGQGGSIVAGPIRTTGAIGLQAAQAIALGKPVVAGTSFSATAGGRLDAADLSAGSTLAIDAGAAQLGTARAGGDIAIRAGTVTAGSLATTGGALAVSATAGDLTVTDAAVAGDATLGATGALVVGTVRAGGAARLTAARVAATTLDATGPLAIEAGGGGARLATIATRGGATLRSAAGLTANTLSAGGGATLTAADDLAVTGAVTVSGDYLLSARSIALGGDGAAVQAAGGRIGATATAGTIRGIGGVALRSGTGGATFTATGANGAIDFAAAAIDAGGQGDVTFAAAGGLTLGGVTAAGRTIAATSSNVTLGGPLAAAGVVLANGNPANLTRIGDAPAANADEYAGGTTRYDLSAAELARVTAATVAVDAGGGALRLGDLALAAGTGSDSVHVRTTGRLDVLGRVSAPGSNAGRTIVVGGGSGEGTRARSIRVAATGGGGGRLIVGDATLDLRGDDIAVGQDAGLLVPLGLTGADTPISSADAASRFVSRPSSTLYDATLAPGAGAYTDPVSVQAGRLVVRYAGFALFQNTGRPGATSGLVLGSTPAAAGGGPVVQLLAAASPNTVALFGTINGIGSTATSLLGPNVVALGAQVTRANSRANGCLIGAAGGGCLSSSLVQPTLNVFDTSRADVFRTADDLTVPFDPLIGTSNEALFSDIASMMLSAEEAPCRDDSRTPCPPPPAGR